MLVNVQNRLVQLVGKMITNPHFLMSAVRKNLRFGKPKAYSMLTTDRIVLEHRIFKDYAADPEIRNILFVGCDADTAGYQKHFEERRYVTLEPNADNRSFGATEHIVGTMERWAAHIPPGRSTDPRATAYLVGGSTTRGIAKRRSRRPMPH